MRWRYEGKRVLKREHRLSFRLLIPVLAVFLLAGSVVAYLSASADEVSNTLQVDQAQNPTIQETFDDTTKTDVNVAVGSLDYAVYVRAAVVVTWKNAEGQVMAVAPVENSDYTIEINGTDWLKDSNGFYYYKYPVDASTTATSNLIDLCQPVEGRAPEGFRLNVEIIAQTVQALGTTDADDKPAVEDAWRVTLSGSAIIAVP